MRKKITKVFVACLSAILITGALSACTAPTAPEQPEAPAVNTEADAGTEVEAPPAAPEETAEEPITISLMTLWAKDNTETIASSIRARLAQYQEENPNVIIEEEGIGDQDAYYTKLKTLAASNDLPDIFVSRGSELAMFAQNGVAAPLNEILDADPAWRDGYVTDAFDDLTVDGSIYGIPYSMLSTHVLYYNADLLSSVGFDSFPATWTEFYALIDALKAAEITPIALGNREAWVANSCILSTLGDRFTGSDWFRSIAGKSGAAFTDPEFVSALAAFQELATYGAFNENMNSIDGDESKTLYYNGEAAMFFDGSWGIGAVVNDAPAEIAAATNVAVLPSVEGGAAVQNTMSGGAGSGLASGVKGFEEKKEVIADILKYVLSEDYSVMIAEKGESPAYGVSDYDTSALSDLAVKYAEMSKTVGVSPIYDSYLNPTVNGILNEGLQELLINVITPEDLAARIQAEYEAN